MAMAASLAHAAGTPPRAHLSLERVRAALLWLTGFAGAFVFIEPSPYEIVSLLAVVVFAATGLALRPGIMPLAVLLTLYNVGFSFALIPVMGGPKTTIWVLVSWYLSGTALFFAAMLGTHTQARLSLLIRGYMLAALLASLTAIAGYFRLLPALSALFMLNERARGTFNDPNVLGAFLVLPALIALQRVFTGDFRAALRGVSMLALFAAAILLSFSRGAWGQCVFSALLLMAFAFVTSRSPRERLRIVLVALAGAVALALFVTALLSFESVAAMFRERAALEQSYDVGRLGRFGRYVLGAIMALDHPFGIGPMQFHYFYVEDPHNAYLNAFLSGGWLSGFCYATLMILSVVIGLRFVFVATPWRPTYLAVYAAFLGVVAESTIIDSDHWRHYFLLLGVLWGLVVAAQPYLRPVAAPRTQSEPR